MNRFVALLLAAPLAATAPFAQSNSDPAIDVLLAKLEDPRALGREGVFPNGVNGCVFATTACNVGTKVIQWKAPMLPDHPFIGFIVARELDGRFEQISDRTFVKHGFFALSSNFCGTCTSPADNSLLGIGCSDTYSVNSNGNQLFLGPPEEIDPWLGQWEPRCSYFDRGDPPATPPLDCNNARSLTSSQVAALGPVRNRVILRDADLNESTGTFWFQAQYVLGTEAESARGNNLGSRGFRPVWTGTMWSLVERDTLLYGSVLQRWTGSTLASATNGADDGRLYVAVKVTGPDPVTGLFHYEYALHNRDNRRGVSALRIPICSGAQIKNLGFRDIDQVAGDDWTSGVVGNELVFSGGANVLEWNTIYNFWFDSDAAPLAGAVSLEQVVKVPGAAAVAVASRAPLELYNVALGPGCAQSTPPTLFAVGTPPRATLGIASFGLCSTGNAALQPSWLRYSVVPGSYALGGCTRYLGPRPGLSFAASTALTDASGTVVHAAPVPNDLALEGLSVSLQALSRDPGHGVLLRNFELSDGLLVRVGDVQPSCP